MVNLENPSIKKIIEKAKKDKNVAGVFLFGSYARGEKNRDIDICLVLNSKLKNIEMSRKLIEYNSLEGLGNIDLSIFQQLPLYIRMEVLKDKIIIHTNNEDKLYEIAFSTIKEFNLYEKGYKLYLETIKNG